MPAGMGYGPDAINRLATHYATSQGVGTDPSVIASLVQQINASPQLLQQLVASERLAAADQDMVNSDYAQHKAAHVGTPPPAQPQAPAPQAARTSEPVNAQGSAETVPSGGRTPATAPAPAPQSPGVTVTAAAPPIMPEPVAPPPIPDVINANQPGDQGLMNAILQELIRRGITVP